jgi:uncharacterized protein (DUF1778 family)
MFQEKRELKSETINIKVTAAQKNTIRELARLQGMNVSEFLLHLCQREYDFQMKNNFSFRRSHR